MIVMAGEQDDGRLGIALRHQLGDEQRRLAPTVSISA